MELSIEQSTTLLQTLQQRFENNKNRHPNIHWSKVEEKLNKNPNKMYSLFLMEQSEGEPDVVDYDTNSKEYIFFDCAKESPKRRSLCYDQIALDSRKQNKPEGSAVEKAREMGTDLLNEKQYRYLQTLGNFDNKTSSWLSTPDAIRKLGGAIFGDYRYDQVFIYHNGAESYYGARGFRACLYV